MEKIKFNIEQLFSWLSHSTINISDSSLTSFRGLYTTIYQYSIGLFYHPSFLPIITVLSFVVSEECCPISSLCSLLTAFWIAGIGLTIICFLLVTIRYFSFLKLGFYLYHYPLLGTLITLCYSLFLSLCFRYAPPLEFTFLTLVDSACNEEVKVPCEEEASVPSALAKTSLWLGLSLIGYMIIGIGSQFEFSLIAEEALRWLTAATIATAATATPATPVNDFIPGFTPGESTTQITIMLPAGLSTQEQLAQLGDFIVTIARLDAEFFPNKRFYEEAQKLMVSFGFQKDFSTRDLERLLYMLDSWFQATGKQRSFSLNTWLAAVSTIAVMNKNGENLSNVIRITELYNKFLIEYTKDT